MNKINKLRQQEAEIRLQRINLEEAENERVQKPYLISLVGTCWKYPRNCYSCPSKESDYWDVYRKILDYVDTEERGFHFIYEEVQVDSNGRASIVVDEHYAYMNQEWHLKPPFSGYVKIKESAYETAKEKTLEEMRTQKKVRRLLKRPY